MSAEISAHSQLLRKAPTSSFGEEMRVAEFLDLRRTNSQVLNLIRIVLLIREAS